MKHKFESTFSTLISNNYLIFGFWRKMPSNEMLGKCLGKSVLRWSAKYFDQFY